jgi:hypothetical protein
MTFSLLLNRDWLARGRLTNMQAACQIAAASNPADFFMKAIDLRSGEHGKRRTLAATYCSRVKN